MLMCASYISKISFSLITECDNADLTSTLEYGDGLVHSVGGQAKVLCRHGYIPGTNFTSARTCHDNGRWQPSLGVCGNYDSLYTKMYCDCLVQIFTERMANNYNRRY